MMIGIIQKKKRSFSRCVLSRRPGALQQTWTQRGQAAKAVVTEASVLRRSLRLRENHSQGQTPNGVDHPIVARTAMHAVGWFRKTDQAHGPPHRHRRASPASREDDEGPGGARNIPRQCRVRGAHHKESNIHRGEHFVPQL